MRKESERSNDTLTLMTTVSPLRNTLHFLAISICGSMHISVLRLCVAPINITEPIRLQKRPSISIHISGEYLRRETWLPDILYQSVIFILQSLFIKVKFLLVNFGQINMTIVSQKNAKKTPQ